MSTMQDDLDERLAARLRAERDMRGWSLTDLATRSGVSRAMISKVERAEASPTAALLGRLSGAFGLTLSALLARAEGDDTRLLRATDQRAWRDPATGLLRRTVSPAGAGLELVEAELPANATIAYPAESYSFLQAQCIWVLEGTLVFHEGETAHRLDRGDCLALGPPAPCRFETGALPCRYLVALVKRPERP